MLTKEITLGGRKYTIPERPMKPNREWRDRLTSMIRPASELVKRATSGEIILPESIAEIRSDPSLLLNLGSATQEIIGLLFNGVDQILAMTIEYCPDLERDREWLEQNAYDSEVFGAFTAVLSLAYPLTGVIQQMARLGSPDDQNLPS